MTHMCGQISHIYVYKRLLFLPQLKLDVGGAARHLGELARTAVYRPRGAEASGLCRGPPRRTLSGARYAWATPRRSGRAVDGSVVVRRARGSHGARGSLCANPAPGRHLGLGGVPTRWGPRAHTRTAIRRYRLSYARCLFRFCFVFVYKNLVYVCVLAETRRAPATTLPLQTRAPWCGAPLGYPRSHAHWGHRSQQYDMRTNIILQVTIISQRHGTWACGEEKQGKAWGGRGVHRLSPCPSSSSSWAPRRRRRCRASSSSSPSRRPPPWPPSSPPWPPSSRPSPPC